MSQPPTDPPPCDSPPTDPPSSVTAPEGGPARAFRLGLTVTELLSAVPWCYLSADADEPPPPLLANVNGEVGRHLARLEELAPDSAAAFATLRLATDELVSATRSGWASGHRRTWVEGRDRLALDGVLEESGARVPTFADAPMRPAWDALRAANDAFSAAAPDALQVLFDLGRAVGETLTPFEHYRQPDFDPGSWLYETIAPCVDRLLVHARRLHPCLAALPELPCGIAAGGSPPFDGMTAAIRALENMIPALLAAAGNQAPTLPAETVASQPLTVPAVTEPTAGETVPAEAVEPPALRVPPLAEGESFAELSAIKERLDPDGTYVGQSLAILRLFQRIEDLNRESNLPVTLLGPSRSGKTCLAGVSHQASDRRDHPFLRLNASELTGGDPNLFREKWTGFGTKSGVSGRKATDTAPGWLRETAGGIIFVDELHSLDRQAVEYLRGLLGRDGTMFRPSSGQREEFCEAPQGSWTARKRCRLQQLRRAHRWRTNARRTPRSSSSRR